MEVSKLGDFSAWAAGAEVEGNWDPSKVTGCPDFSDRATRRVGHDQLQEMCSSAASLFPSLVSL